MPNATLGGSRRTISKGLEFAGPTQRRQALQALELLSTTDLSPNEVAKRIKLAPSCLQQWRKFPWWEAERSRFVTKQISRVRDVNTLAQSKAASARLLLLDEVLRRVLAAVEDGSLQTWSDNRIREMMAELRLTAERSEVLEELMKVSTIARELETVQSMRKLGVLITQQLESVGVDVEAEMKRRTLPAQLQDPPPIDAPPEAYTPHDADAVAADGEHNAQGERPETPIEKQRNPVPDDQSTEIINPGSLT